jgi:hypothetical protein
MIVGESMRAAASGKRTGIPQKANEDERSRLREIARRSRASDFP